MIMKIPGKDFEEKNKKMCHTFFVLLGFFNTINGITGLQHNC